jgi:hypothetical protein
MKIKAILSGSLLDEDVPALCPPHFASLSHLSLGLKGQETLSTSIPDLITCYHASKKRIPSLPTDTQAAAVMHMLSMALVVWPLVTSFTNKATALKVTVWGKKNCINLLGGITTSYVVPADGCFIKGESDAQLEYFGREGEHEVTVFANSTDDASESEFVVFFTSDDCNPDNLIEGAYLDDGCATAETVDGWEAEAKDYKSWAVWDMCGGEIGCPLD